MDLSKKSRRDQFLQVLSTTSTFRQKLLWMMSGTIKRMCCKV